MDNTKQDLLLYDWVCINEEKMSKRLFNYFMELFNTGKYKYDYKQRKRVLVTLDKNSFLLSESSCDFFVRLEKFQSKMWQEFVTLRGY